MPNARARSARRLARGSLALVAAVALLAACGDDDDSDVGAGIGDTTETTAATGTAGGSAGDDYGAGTTAGGDGEAGVDAASVTAAGFEFDGATVAAGAEVALVNQDEVPHTMTADDGEFDTGRVDGGGTATVTAPGEPGEYPFHCEIHPEMTGVLTVEG